MAAGGKQVIERFGGASTIRLLRKPERLHISALIAKENGRERAARKCALKAFELLTDRWGGQKEPHIQKYCSDHIIDIEGAINPVVYAAKIAKAAGILDTEGIQKRGRKILEFLQKKADYYGYRMDLCIVKVAEAFGWQEVISASAENALRNALGSMHHKADENEVKKIAAIAETYLSPEIAREIAEDYIQKRWRQVQSNPVGCGWMVWTIGPVAEIFGVDNETVREARKSMLERMMNIKVNLILWPNKTDRSGRLDNAVRKAEKWGLSDYALVVARKLFEERVGVMRNEPNIEHYLDRGYEAFNYANYFGFTEELKPIGAYLVTYLTKSKIEVDIYWNSKKRDEYALDLALMCGMEPDDKRIAQITKRINEQKIRQYLLCRLFVQPCPAAPKLADEGKVPQTPEELGKRFDLAKEDVLRIATELVNAAFVHWKKENWKKGYSYEFIHLARIAKFCGLDELMRKTAKGALEWHLTFYGAYYGVGGAISISQEFGLEEDLAAVREIKGIMD